MSEFFSPQATPQQSGPALVEVKNLRKWYPVGADLFGRPRNLLKATDDVSFRVHRNEILGIVGESGSGKSTVGKLVLKLTEATSGQIEFDGIDISDMSRKQLRPLRRRMQMVFQDPFASLNPRMTVGEILETPLRIQNVGADHAAREEKVAEILDLVGLSRQQAARFPHEFSGGQRQRISIARALVTSPEFLVADEPVSALDVSIQAQIIKLFLDIRQSLGLGMLFISHDLAVTGYLCDRIAVMYLGRIVEIGTTAHLFEAPAHPYTEALFSAVPSVDPQRRATRIIPKGDIPSPIDLPSGCSFRMRCRYALPACGLETPELREVAPGHFKACIRDDLSLQSWNGEHRPAATPTQTMEN
jgi:oligopeptide transport system ATP-binding protein